MERLLDRIRHRIPGVALRTSFIVGFPGETEVAFSRLVDFVRAQRFDRVGVFIYSREENTGAYDLADQVPARVMRARRARLMELQAEVALEKNRGLVGQEVEVMVESHAPGQARLQGRTASQAPDIDGMVFLRGEAEPGEFVRARIERAFTYDLHARVIDAIEVTERLATHA